MRVQSFMRQGGELVPVQVELTLAPGLPQILFLGLPDAALRESALRIRAAIRKQGFRLPKAQQVLVHLRPNHLRKTSRGLDLAVAAALLWETKQVAPPAEDAIPTLYGELTLSGSVEAPDDVAEINMTDGLTLFTGDHSEALSFAHYRLNELKDLGRDRVFTAAQTGDCEISPALVRARSFPVPAAQIAALVAAGEHSTVIAGPAGSGKSTLVESIPSWIEAPSGENLRIARRYARQMRVKAVWRPIVRPHHSTPALSMIGGGMMGWSGEITRAHSGVLILDELCEFSPRVQEALREPIETGEITIARAGTAHVYPARFLLLATTNLCKCGRFVPRLGLEPCRCSKVVRRRILSRLHGPFADRFSIFAYSDEWSSNEERISSDEIARSVNRAIQFRIEQRGQTEPNSRLAPERIEATLSRFQRSELLSVLSHGSQRRRDAVLQIARTAADLRQSPQIEHIDLDQALALGHRGHLWLEQWRE